MVFSTQHLSQIFANLEAQDNGCTYNEFKALSYDLSNREFEGDAREANQKVRNVAFQIFGLDPEKKYSRRDLKRAINKHKNEFFEVYEDEIDIKVATGFHENEFFNEFVEEKNIAAGDDQTFWSNENVLLSVAKTAGSHHNITVQRLGRGESFTVPMSTYTIAVGVDIELYLLRRIDFAELTDRAASAFVRKIQAEIYAAVMTVGDKIPAATQFHKTLAMATNATKDEFDQLIEDVETANETPAVIMGTKTALKRLSIYADVDWASNEQKLEMNTLGRLGSYEGTTLIEIPQRFKDNDVATKLVDSKKLLIMPVGVDNKFVKFVDRGETEITEMMEKADRNDDTNFYQIEREMGIGVQVTRYFGVVDIAD